MRLTESISVLNATKLLECRCVGETDLMITGINELHKVTKGDLTFVDHPKYYDRVIGSAADVIIINKEMTPPAGKAFLISDDPFRDYNRMVAHVKLPEQFGALISKTAMIGKSSKLAPGVVVGERVHIGEGCVIHPNVVLYSDTFIDNDVTIHANTVIGSEAFYYKTRAQNQQQYDKLLSCGRVVVNNGVEIGSNCSIDKGVSGDTIIGEGTKIDNLVHIGHGTTIGKNCLIAAQVGIAGKVNIGDRVILWGQVGVSKDLDIGSDTVIMAQSGVAKSLEGNASYFGSPVMEARQKMKELALMKRMINNSKFRREL